jgi:hypothetical protein
MRLVDRDDHGVLFSLQRARSLFDRHAVSRLAQGFDAETQGRPARLVSAGFGAGITIVEIGDPFGTPARLAPEQVV